MTKLTINRLMLHALESAHLACDFEVIASTFEDEHDAAYAAEYVAGILGRTDTEDAPFDCLEFTVFRSTKNSDDFITDALITCGGPYANARYESGLDAVTVTFRWGTDCLMVRSSGAPICEVLESVSEY